MHKEIMPDFGGLLGKIDGYISIALKADLFKHRVFDPQNLRMLNRCMAVIILLAALYLITDIILVNPSRNAISMISGLSASGASQSLTENAMPVETKGYSYYSNNMSGRNIFTADSHTESDDLSGPGEPADDSVGLVGIISGNDPQAIIEDKKSQQTYYIKKGQTVSGISVEEISDGRVSLDYRGKNMILSL